MFYVYLLQSEKSGKIYIGSTNDLKRRLSQHNANREKSTKKKGPWEIVYYEAYRTSKLAKNRERRLKQFGKSLAMLKKRIGIAA